jgi:hypothetical protein
VAVSTPIQIFLAWRIKIITKSNWIAVIICFLAIVGLGASDPTVITYKIPTQVYLSRWNRDISQGCNYPAVFPQA